MKTSLGLNIVVSAFIALTVGCSAPQRTPPASLHSAPPITLGSSAASPTTAAVAPARSAMSTAGVRASASPATAVGVLPSGTFTLDVDGSAVITECTTRQDRVPSPITLRIEPPSRTAQQRTTRDERGGTDAGQVVTTVSELRPDGVYMVSQRVEQHGVAASTYEFRPDPPVRVAAFGPAVGSTWSYELTSTDGALRTQVESTLQAVDDEVTLGDTRTVAATRVAATSRTRGTVSGVQVDTTTRTIQWSSRDTYLPVKADAETSGTSGPCRLHRTTHTLLRSIDPAR